MLDSVLVSRVHLLWYLEKKLRDGVKYSRMTRILVEQPEALIRQNGNITLLNIDQHVFFESNPQNRMIGTRYAWHLRQCELSRTWVR